MIYRGHVKHGIVVFDEPAPLADGTVVQVHPVQESPGSSHDVLADFWEAHSLDRLLNEQSAAAGCRFADRLGGWPVEELNDGFEE